MSRWTMWRKRPSLRPAADIPGPVAARGQRDTNSYWAAEVVPTVLAWLLPSGAAVVGALGQFMLALVLLTLALGVWLRLWRGRKKRRAANRPVL
ncbi:MAG: hypothetical protein KKH21_14410 [Gammaproteobacteria bacterium]|nr:hypothetical protein [Gammaproteobacteria bacterium]MBU0892055.1 hypothetical protein [Gammaproteobacteria bacterium]